MEYYRRLTLDSTIIFPLTFITELMCITWHRCFQNCTWPAMSSFGVPASSIRSSTSSRTATTATPASTSSQVDASPDLQTRPSHHTWQQSRMPVNTHAKCKDSIQWTKDNTMEDTVCVKDWDLQSKILRQYFLHISLVNSILCMLKLRKNFIGTNVKKAAWAGMNTARHALMRDTIIGTQCTLVVLTQTFSCRR